MDNLLKDIFMNIKFLTASGGDAICNTPTE